jgi:hypothetical protein
MASILELEQYTSNTKLRDLQYREIPQIILNLRLLKQSLGSMYVVTSFQDLIDLS